MPDARLNRTRQYYCEVDPSYSRVCEAGTVGCIIQHWPTPDERLTKTEDTVRIDSLPKKETDGTGE